MGGDASVDFKEMADTTPATEPVKVLTVEERLTALENRVTECEKVTSLHVPV